MYRNEHEHMCVLQEDFVSENDKTFFALCLTINLSLSSISVTGDVQPLNSSLIIIYHLIKY
jgi:hypothetical protein